MPTTTEQDNYEFQVPDYTVQQRRRAERRKMADDLMKQSMQPAEGQMVSGIYVPANDGWSNVAKGFASGYMSDRANAEEESEAKQLADIRSELLRRMPAAADPDAMAKWGAQASQVAGLAPLGAAAFKEGIDRKAATSHAPVEITDAEGNTRLFDRAGNLIKDLGKVGKPTRDPSAGAHVVTDDSGNVRIVDNKGNIVAEPGRIGRTTQPPSFQFMPTEGGIVGLNPKNPMAPPIQTGLTPPPSAATQQGRRESTAGINIIDAAEKAVDTAPSAFGFVQGTAGGTDLGATILNKMSSKKEIEARAKVQNIGSQIIHDRSGAAVTIAEAPRLKPFIPSTSDDARTVRVKLKALREKMAEEGYSFGVKSGTLDKKPTVVRTGTRNGKRVAEYSDGTIREVQ